MPDESSAATKNVTKEALDADDARRSRDGAQKKEHVKKKRRRTLEPRVCKSCCSWAVRLPQYCVILLCVGRTSRSLADMSKVVFGLTRVQFLLKTSRTKRKQSASELSTATVLSL